MALSTHRHTHGVDGVGSQPLLLDLVAVLVRHNGDQGAHGLAHLPRHLEQVAHVASCKADTDTGNKAVLPTAQAWMEECEGRWVEGWMKNRWKGGCTMGGREGGKWVEGWADKLVGG